MKNPRIAIISFPGTNGDVENVRCLKRNGFDAFVFRWNDSTDRLSDVDGYFLGAGFSYEDRGRAGMVAARDPFFQFLHEEAEKGKVIVGHCNGCQVLIESGLIPLGKELTMCMARNAIKDGNGWRAPGFLNEWIWITPTCKPDRCATSDWTGAMHIPIAHGEGRFVTKDPELIKELEKNDQIAFQYCDASGNISDDASITLNGSTSAIAGICNPAGNVIAMMPHAERTTNGDPYFASMRNWIERCKTKDIRRKTDLTSSVLHLPQEMEKRSLHSTEIFIDTIIVNNEERTVEQAARRIAPDLNLKQFRYMAPSEKSPEEILTTIALFNPNKEVAYVRKCHAERSEPKASGVEAWSKWNPDEKKFDESKSPLHSTSLLRRDEPDVGASNLGKGSETGICYSFKSTSDDIEPKLQEIFANPHASSLELLAR
jgi:phosphoribosylformylglycinamidine synthase